jgi:hypothetical protein
MPFLIVILRYSAGVVSTDAVRSVTARAMIDDNTEYSATAQLTTEERDSNLLITPSVVVVIPGREDIVLDGSLVMRQSRKIDVDLALRNLMTQPINLRGAAFFFSTNYKLYSFLFILGSIDKLSNRRHMKYGGELEFSSYFLNGRVEGFVDHNKASGQSLASRMTIEYTYMGAAQQSIVLSNKIRDKSTETTLAYSLDSAWRSSFWPRYDGEVSMDFTFGQNTLTTNLNAGLDEIRRVVFAQTANYQVAENSAAVTGSARFQFPLKVMPNFKQE